jgi:hypothetical protein
MMADLTRQQQQLIWGVEWLFKAGIRRGALGNLNFGYLRTGGTGLRTLGKAAGYSPHRRGSLASRPQRTDRGVEFLLIAAALKRLINAEQQNSVLASKAIAKIGLDS